jgi:phage terminase large subunit
MRPTTALRKIAKLRKRIWAVRGGQGAGKTYSILQLIVNHASSVPNQEIYIASHELSKMRRTVIKDFKKIMIDFGIYEDKRFLAGTHYKFQNGSFISFIGVDKADMGKGLRSDIVYVNEANKLSFEAYRELTSRAKRIILDWNPNAEFWADTEVIPRSDCDFLTLTFEDNECLSKEERAEILSYKEKGYDKNGNEINSYWANKWRVYGLGMIGIVDGCVFQNWEEKEFDINLPFGYGVDFGYKDPFTCIKIAIDRKKMEIYVKQEIYQSFLSPVEIIDILEKRGIDKSKPMLCDSADPGLIRLIRDENYNARPIIKDPVINGIRRLQDYTIYIDPNSHDVKKEFRNYVWLDKSGEAPIDDFNHSIDPLRYYEKFHTFKQQ